MATLCRRQHKGGAGPLRDRSHASLCRTPSEQPLPTPTRPLLHFAGLHLCPPFPPFSCRIGPFSIPLCRIVFRFTARAGDAPNRHCGPKLILCILAFC